MKMIKNEEDKNNGSCNVLKKLWQCVWNSGGSVSDCPNQPRSAQDIRDEGLKKCPWYEQ